jgi:hypothetical protein
VRSAVPKFATLARGTGFSERTSEALFGREKYRPQVSRSLFDNAYERVKAGFPEGALDAEHYDPEDFTFTYDPTKSSEPPRPRTLRAAWARRKGEDTGTVIIQFREGAVYEYYDVPYNVWRNFRRVESPGKAMNRPKGLIGGGYRYRRVYG